MSEYYLAMNLDMFFYQLDKLFESNDLELAEEFMREAISMCKERGDIAGEIAICNELAGFYRAVGRFDEAFEIYEQALTAIESINSRGSEGHGSTLINMATTYTMIGDFDKALNLYEEASKIFSADDYAADERLATMYNNMSFIYQEKGDYEKAEEILNSALYILNAAEESEIDKAITYTNLSHLYIAMEKIPEAKVAVKRSLDLFIENGGLSNPNYSAAVGVLGQIYYIEEKYDKASALFKQAMTLTERDFGTESENYQIMKDNFERCEEKLA